MRAIFTQHSLAKKSSNLEDKVGIEELKSIFWRRYLFAEVAESTRHPICREQDISQLVPVDLARGAESPQPFPWWPSASRPDAPQSVPQYEIMFYVEDYPFAHDTIVVSHTM